MTTTNKDQATVTMAALVADESSPRDEAVYDMIRGGSLANVVFFLAIAKVSLFAILYHDRHFAVCDKECLLIYIICALGYLGFMYAIYGRCLLNSNRVHSVGYRIEHWLGVAIVQIVLFLIVVGLTLAVIAITSYVINNFATLGVFEDVRSFAIGTCIVAVFGVASSFWCYLTILNHKPRGQDMSIIV